MAAACKLCYPSRGLNRPRGVSVEATSAPFVSVIVHRLQRGQCDGSSEHDLLRQASNIIPRPVVAPPAGQYEAASVMVKWGPPIAGLLPRSPSRRWQAIPVPMKALCGCMAFVMMAAAGLLCWRPQVWPHAAP